MPHRRGRARGHGGAARPRGRPGGAAVRPRGAHAARRARGRGDRAARARAAPRRRRLSLRPRRLALAGGLAALLGAAVFAGTQIGGDELPGSLELQATLSSPAGASASATVRETGVGRVIDFRTDELPILPKGDYYELWFVGPGDRPGRVNRISAGTFHPDAQGRSNVRFAAAVDPAKYPGLAVTAEPGDGDPAPSRPDVMRSPQP